MYLFYLCLIFILFFIGAVHASDNEVIVLSATRVSVPEKEVGGSVTIISREEIERSNAVTLVDVLRIVPGVAISQSGPHGALTQVRIRGAEANHALVLIDGVEANDPANFSEFNFAYLLPESIERIEVLRGPQSSVWGSDALAGVINVITRSGSSDTRFTSSAEVGSYDFIHSSASVSSSLGGLNYYLQGSYLDTSGVNIAEQGSEEDGYDHTSIVFNTQYEFSPYFKFGLNTRHIDTSNEFDGLSSITGRPIDADNETNTEQFYGRLFLQLSLFNELWKQNIGLGVTDTHNQNKDSFGERRTEGEKLKIDYLSEVAFNTRLLTNEQHRFLFAIEQEEERFKQRGEASFFGDPNQNQDIKNHGVTAEYRLGLWDRLFLSAALRKDYNDKFKNRDTVRFVGSYNFPNYATKLRASYGTGVKNPSFTELFGFFEDSFIGNPDLKPEKSEAWEFGIDHSFAAESINLGTTFFWEDLKDEIISSFTTVDNLNGRSERNGVEFYIDAALSNRLDVRSAYTYTDSTAPDNNGKQVREIRRPKTVASLQLNYKTVSGKVSINGSLNYVSEQIDLDFSSFPASEVKLNDYYLMNLSGSYKIAENINFYARINNLLNDSYQDVYGFETLDRTVYAGVKVNL